MAETPNFWRIYDRLLEDEGLDPNVAILVEAALRGDVVFESALSGESSAIDASERPSTSEPPRPSGAFLQRLEVERFRGVGQKVSVNFTTSPGLTLVVGRNGSGKSSLAEGLETLLTGDSLRWANRKPAKEWRQGWRNLHDQGSVNLRAVFSVEDRIQSVSLARNWPVGAGLDAGSLAVREGTTELSGVDALDWEGALQSCRPFLSYNELSAALDSGPSKLFDALEGLLGLDDVTEARERVRQARLAIDRANRAVKKDREALIRSLEQSEDERAVRALAQFKPRSTGLAELEDLVLATEEEAADSELQSLRQLAGLSAPSDSEVLRVSEELRQAIEAQAALAATDAGRALETAELLEQAIRWFASQSDATCPVCETPSMLSERWKDTARARSEEMRASAGAVQASVKRVTSAVDALRRMVRNTANPTSHELAARAAAASARDTWGALPDGPLAMADHVLAELEPLRTAFQLVAAEATSRLDALQLAWRPLKIRLTAWLEDARKVEGADETLKLLKAVEKWYQEAEADLRDEAFTPIANQAQATWNLLRQQSNVELGRPRLAGTTTNRKVKLDITVDGTSGVALGVMSQGELHALALSLFLPRLTRPDSPFRFLIIDDPVQAMDPAKVDGLARVLESAARTHQVIVFTHDARLPAAVRRLGIAANILGVERHVDSKVEVTPRFNPVQHYFEDAKHLYHQRDALGVDLVRTVVPGICRAAVEAAFMERAWSQELAKGRRHRDIEQALAASTGLTSLAALAFFGDHTRGGDVLKRLNSIGSWAADQFQELKAHAHDPLPAKADIRKFITDSEGLAKAVRS